VHGQEPDAGRRAANPRRAQRRQRAALALCRAIDLPLAPLLHGLREYRGQPHRVELVSAINDVEYYDDSKGTNVGATVAALNGLGKAFTGENQRLVVILGGDGKGQDFAPLAEPVAATPAPRC
jgi:UDP-N-acetylmuramoylalanine--D-glutamate ligase